VASVIKKLRKKQVKEIKLLIVSGKGLNEVAELYGVSYITIYKIAAGITWKKVKPTGKLIGKRDYVSKRVFSLKDCQVIALKKMKKRFSNDILSRQYDTSESTIQRAIENGKAALGFRFHKMTLNGGVSKAQQKCNLTDEEVQSLVNISVSGEVPEWIRREFKKCQKRKKLI